MSAPHQSRATCASMAAVLLRRFDLVPDFVVLGAAGNILPEIYSLLVLVYIVEMQVFLLLRRHELRRLRVRRSIAGHVSDFLLGLRLDHELEKLVSEICVVDR